MISLKQIVTALDARSLNTPDGWETVDVHSVFASDLISDILVCEGEQVLLVSSLTSPQVLRTAEVIDAAAVVFVNRQQVPPDTEHLAAGLSLPVFVSSISKFEACVRLGREGVCS